MTAKSTFGIQHLAWLIALFTAVAVIGLFMLLGRFAYPSADDFCMAAGARNYGLLSYLWQHYFDWSGRYSGNALYGLYPTLFGLLAGYPWLAALLIIALLAAAARLLASVFGLAYRSPSVWLVSTLFVAVYLLGLRHTASSLYWLAGAMTYQSAHILLLFTLAAMLGLMQRQQRSLRAPWLTGGLVLLIVLGVGTNEINMIVLTLLMSVAYVFHRVYLPGRHRVWWWLLLVTLACFAVVYLSPGNSMREATFPLRHDWSRSVDGSLRMGAWTLKAWTLNPVFIAGSLLAPFAIARLAFVSGRVTRPAKMVLLALAVFTLAMPFLLQFPAWWAMGGWPPPRTVDAIFFIFLLGWLSLIAVLTLRLLPLSLIYSGDGRMTPRALTGLVLASLSFIAAVSLNSRFQRAAGDLVERAAPFQQYMARRHDLIREARSNGQYSLQAPAYRGDPPRSIYFNDIRPNWRDWRNVCYADYFGLRAIQRDRGGQMDAPGQQRDEPL